MDEEYFNVAFTLAEWLKEVDIVNNNQSTALSFDLFDVTPVLNMFDAYATGPTGIYKHTAFTTETVALKDIVAVIEFAANLPDDCPKLLYGLLQIQDADKFCIDYDVPAKFILKYAVVSG